MSNDSPTMTSSRPYIVRSIYEWILDNECTPYVLVNAMADGVMVPVEFVKNGQIVLNVSPMSVVKLLMTNDAMEFNGRFSGVPKDIYVPMSAIMGIYARENGQGMMFEIEEPSPQPPKSKSMKSVPNNTAKSKSDDKSARPSLKVVK